MTKIVAAISYIFLIFIPSVVLGDLRTDILRNAAKEFIYNTVPFETRTDVKKVKLGEKLFNDKNLSLNGDIACASCHIDKFGSADGLPNSIGVGGKGVGVERIKSGGVIVPRNSLPLWGRAEEDFKVFFWDGKVEKREDTLISQFGRQSPSTNPLIVAIHLPFVELREMIIDTDVVNTTLKSETVESASKIYYTLLERINNNQNYRSAFIDAYNIKPSELEFIHIADSNAQFIQDKFRIRASKFENFVTRKSNLSSSEIQGGLIFFGKGKCVSCHNGKHYSDFEFHAIPFPQIGFGKNGFGVDYGRFNVTHDPKDLYKFRTPPLTNVENTAPYGHSGSAQTLKEAIIYHIDPLRLLKTQQMSAIERNEYYRKLLASNNILLKTSFLDDNEIHQLVQFLKTLSFD
ncbi:MAG: His-Xaa-Ser system-associated MauG-like protein [Gammaproteobacteria bacterium]|nr:His-Xaa-Ser system-associated MauG-like protein [Gammaproteobacteria bacterium]